MPFCPSCRSEYKAGTTTCADCGVNLVDKLDDTSSPEDMVDIYVCYNPQQAERTAELLREKGVHVLVRDRRSSAFPTTVGQTAQCLLAVGSQEVELGRSVIEAAVHDGVIPSDGQILTESED